MKGKTISMQTESTKTKVFMISYDLKYVKSLVDKILNSQKEISDKLDQLFEMRFIEKIARPASTESKQQIAQQFKKKTTEIHALMQEIQQDFDLSSLAMERESQKIQKIKKKLQVNMHVKLCLFNIRKKYVDTLVHSNFQLYAKLRLIFSIQQDIHLINPDKWLSKCIQKIDKKIGSQKNVCC